MKLSVVTTMYQSAGYIEEFYSRASAAARQLVEEDFEIIFVNDGSPDDNAELAIALSKKHDNVVVVDLSRNFGHHNAMMAGLAQSCSEQVFLIDSDLEEDPAWLFPFSQQMLAESSDVVFGVQESRKGGWFERISGAVYYWILDWMLDIQHEKNITTARLMTREYVDALLLHHERAIVISCIWQITGFVQSVKVVQKKTFSKTTYNIVRKFSHLVNTITSFSSKPLIAIFFTGLSIFTISLLYALYLLFIKFFLDLSVDGWTSIMASIWLLGGITVSFIGVIGIYLSKIFIEVKQRPNYIVRNIYGRRQANK